MRNRKSQKNERTSKTEELRDKPARGRSARFRQLFDPSRSGAVLFILLTVGTYIAVRLTAPSGAEHAQLRFIEEIDPETSDVEAGSQVSYREPLSGTAYETAIRLREAGALGMAISLAVFARHASAGTAPAAPHDVTREMVARKLLPPGIEIENGSFRSDSSDLRFSYRNEPLSFEILALPKASGAGSALLLRFPLAPSATNSVMYFESQNPAQAPAPFSTDEQITAAGWRIRQWRGDALPLNEAVVRELREQDNWLKSLNQGR